MAQSGLIGDFEIGVQPLWPLASADIADFFDRPPWERPTDDNPFVLPEGGAESFETPVGFNGNGISTGSPGFTGAITPGMSWTPGAGGNDGGTVTVVNSDGVITINIVASRRYFYRLEIYDADGDKVAAVPDWITGKLKLQMDRASVLEFTIPASSPVAADLQRPNIIWLRDRWGFVIDTFQVQRRKARGTGDASYFDIHCLGAMAQLGEEPVAEYEGGDITVLEHVEALIDLQVKSNALTLGTIDADIAEIATPLYGVDTNIHALLLSLQASLPKDQRGRLYVDPQRRLQWRLTVGDPIEQAISRKNNVYAVESESDPSRVINRLYFYGEGNDPATRLSLIDAGEPEEYVEDTDSQTAYGLQPFRKVDRRFRNPESLLRAANRILEEFAAPPVTVAVELLDLAKADDANPAWHDIYIGGRYRVVDTDLGIDSVVEIVQIQIDLTRPVPIKVDLTNQVRDLSDILQALVDATQQPLHVLGDRYPNMGRNLSNGGVPENYRAGDTRWNDSESRGEMHDGSDWQGMGAGSGWVTATTYGGLDDPSGIDEKTTMGRVTEGNQEGIIYRIDANDVWVSVNEAYFATTKAGLTNNSDVQRHAMGFVTAGADQGMVCIRNSANDGWDAVNFFE